MEIGSHSCSHPWLDKLGDADAVREISESRAFLQRTFGVAVDHFAYPFGDYTAATQDILKRLGFRSAVTTSPGVNVRDTDRFQWLRRQPWEADVDAFAFRFAMERLRA